MDWLSQHFLPSASESFSKSPHDIAVVEQQVSEPSSRDIDFSDPPQKCILIVIPIDVKPMSKAIVMAVIRYMIVRFMYRIILFRSPISCDKGKVFLIR